MATSSAPHEDDMEAKVLRYVERVESVPEEHGPLFGAVWMIAGVTVFLVGLAMSVLPGPAVIVIPVGLAMLAGRFVWARNLLSAGIRLAFRLGRRLRSVGRTQKLLALFIVLCVAGGVAVLVLL